MRLYNARVHRRQNCAFYRTRILLGTHNPYGDQLPCCTTNQTAEVNLWRHRVDEANKLEKKPVAPCSLLPKRLPKSTKSRSHAQVQQNKRPQAPARAPPPRAQARRGRRGPAAPEPPRLAVARRAHPRPPPHRARHVLHLRGQALQRRRALPLGRRAAQGRGARARPRQGPARALAARRLAAPEPRAAGDARDRDARGAPAPRRPGDGVAAVVGGHRPLLQLPERRRVRGRRGAGPRRPGGRAAPRRAARARVADGALPRRGERLDDEAGAGRAAGRERGAGEAVRGAAAVPRRDVRRRVDARAERLRPGPRRPARGRREPVQGVPAVGADDVGRRRRRLGRFDPRGNQTSGAPCRRRRDVAPVGSRLNGCFSHRRP